MIAELEHHTAEAKHRLSMMVAVYMDLGGLPTLWNTYLMNPAWLSDEVARATVTTALTDHAFGAPGMLADYATTLRNLRAWAGQGVALHTAAGNTWNPVPLDPEIQDTESREMLLAMAIAIAGQIPRRRERRDDGGQPPPPPPEPGPRGQG